MFSSHGVFLIAVLFAFGSAVRAEDWPQFLGAERRGQSSETNLVESIPASGLPVVWRQSIGPGYAGPIVVGDRVIVFHFRDGKEVLEARASKTGSVLWTVEYECNYDGGMFRELGPRATPCSQNGKVVSLGSDAVLQCVDIETGKLRWRKFLAKEFEIPDSYFGVACSPVIEGDLAIINLGGRNGAGIVAVRISDGGLAWKQTDDGASYSSPVVADLAGRRTLLVFARSGLHALDAKTGQAVAFVRWRARIDASVNAATPLVKGSQVFISSSYNVGATVLDFKTKPPTTVWKSNDVLTCHYNTCVESNGFLFGIDGRQEGGARLQCAEWSTGKAQWTEEGFGCASVILADGKLWILMESGELVLARANPTKFEVLGRQRLVSEPCRAHPAISNQSLYVRNNNELVKIAIGKTN